MIKQTNIITNRIKFVVKEEDKKTSSVFFAQMLNDESSSGKFIFKGNFSVSCLGRGGGGVWTETSKKLFPISSVNQYQPTETNCWHKQDTSGFLKKIREIEKARERKKIIIIFWTGK